MHTILLFSYFTSEFRVKYKTIYTLWVWGLWAGVWTISIFSLCFQLIFRALFDPNTQPVPGEENWNSGSPSCRTWTRGIPKYRKMSCGNTELLLNCPSSGRGMNIESFPQQRLCSVDCRRSLDLSVNEENVYVCFWWMVKAIFTQQTPHQRNHPNS